MPEGFRYKMYVSSIESLEIINFISLKQCFEKNVIDQVKNYTIV